MFVVNSCFIGKYKIGNNIVWNLKTLKAFYKCISSARSEEDKLLFYKPTIILMASIIEAVLYDFHLRVKAHTIEGVRGLTKAQLDKLRKVSDKFHWHIAAAKSHNILHTKSDLIYRTMDDLRKLRNRVHIQNEKNDFEPDDSDAFSEARLRLAEKTLEKVLKVMATRYPRAESMHYVADFELPWKEHFPRKTVNKGRK